MSQMKMRTVLFFGLISLFSTLANLAPAKAAVTDKTYVVLSNPNVYGYCKINITNTNELSFVGDPTGPCIQKSTAHLDCKGSVCTGSTTVFSDPQYYNRPYPFWHYRDLRLTYLDGGKFKLDSDWYDYDPDSKKWVKEEEPSSEVYVEETSREAYHRYKPGSMLMMVTDNEDLMNSSCGAGTILDEKELGIGSRLRVTDSLVIPGPYGGTMVRVQVVQNTLLNPNIAAAVGCEGYVDVDAVSEAPFLASDKPATGSLHLKVLPSTRGMSPPSPLEPNLPSCSQAIHDLAQGLQASSGYELGTLGQAVVRSCNVDASNCTSDEGGTAKYAEIGACILQKAQANRNMGRRAG